MPRSYELSYAGVTLPLSTPAHQEWLEQIHPQLDFKDWDAWNFEGFNLKALPTPSLPVAPKPRCGVLHWPTGACRPAWFHCVVSTDRLNTIRNAVGDPSVPQNLVMLDGRTGKGVTALMYLLPARPLNQIGVKEAEDAWILTLADQRFYWHWKRGEVPEPVSWTDLFTQLGVILDVDILTDTIDPRYQTPSSKWVKHYEPTSTILDAAAAQIGHRVICLLDGTVKTVQWKTAKTASDTYLVDAHVLSGGFLNAADIGRYVPEKVNVLFRQTTSGSGSGSGSSSTSSLVPFVVPETLTGLAIPEYGVSHGVTGTQGQVYADFTYDGTNIGEVTDYAIVSATDWYGWRLPDTDLVFPGAEPWVPTGWEDFAEWSYLEIFDGRLGKDAPFASTLIRRGPWDAFPSGNFLDNNQATGNAPEFKVECQDGFLILLKATISLGPDGLTQTEYEFDSDLGVECTPAGSGSGGSGSGGSGSGQPEPDFPVQFETVSKVCATCPASKRVTSNYQILAEDFKIEIDASGGNVTVTLPEWEDCLFFIIVRVDGSGNTATVSAGSGTITGVASVPLTTQWESFTVDTLSTPGGWFIS